MTVATPLYAYLLATLYLGLQVFFIARALLRPYRQPVSRLAWVVVMLAAPIVGMVAYILVGETNIGRGRSERKRRVMEELPQPPPYDGQVPEHYVPLFRAGMSINGYPPTGGNSAELMADSDATILRMVEDIDAATETVHILFYIWLADTNGLKVVEALKRAAARGVTCRVMADDFGSRAMIRSAHWKAMGNSGVILARAMPVPNPPISVLWGRIDMRNHRKIAIIDNRITYCGSQNCADAAFAVKPRFAPWVDIMVRFEGPVVRQNQHLFATDWMGHGNDDISALIDAPLPPPRGSIVAQVVGTGAMVRPSAMPEIFDAVINTARSELIVTTPYYVPDETIQAALCAAAYRGVDTTFIVPQRNDSWVVAAASRSYYEELLAAGVKIHEYVGGLLHSKTMTIDGQACLIGSANIDRRSFELNFENNILLHDAELTGKIRARQQVYLAASVPVLAADVAAWPRRRRLWNNAIAMLGPVL